MNPMHKLLVKNFLYQMGILATASVVGNFVTDRVLRRRDHAELRSALRSARRVVTDSDVQREIDAALET